MEYYSFSILTALLLLPIFTCFIPQVQAGSIVPANDGVNTIVNYSNHKYDIIGGKSSADGANLFQSFDQFGLKVGETANFIANPSVQNILSRVIGGKASVINGLIQVTGSNANLFLMNPAGIIFGKSASLQVPAAFTVTTANGIGFADQWFSNSGSNNYAQLMGNPQTFTFTSQQPGSIINAGNLAVNPGAGLTFLAGTIISLGKLSAPGGQIIMAAVPGENLVRLSLPGSLLSLEFQPLTGSEVTPSPLSIPALLTGDGTKKATNLIQNSDGTFQIQGSSQTFLPASGMAIVSNSIDVSGQHGGNVDIFGHEVGLIKANINASGTNNGGTVLIGGDSQGKGDVPHASFTYVSHDSLINADSLLNGNGGKVVIWADNTTRFYGTITARGGSLSGDGGFVETSGKQDLEIPGASVNASATQGKAGTWFLDPLDVTIIDQPTSGVNNSGSNMFTSINTNAVINPTMITTALNLGENVNITTGTNGSQAGNITVSSPITGLSTGAGLATLTLDASNNILINAPIQAISGGKSWNVNLTAANDITIRAGISTLGGNLTSTSQTFDSSSANITTSNIAGLSAGNINISSSVDAKTGVFDTSQIQGASGKVNLISPNIIQASVNGNVNIVVSNTANSPFQVLGTLVNNTKLSTNTPSLVFDINSNIAPSLSLAPNPVPPPNQENSANPINTKKEGGPEKSGLPLVNNQQNNNSLPKIQTDLSKLENKFVDEFTNHLSIPNLHNITLSNANETLNQINLATGIKPAIIYISFVETSSNSQQDEKSLQLILVTAQGNPIRKQISGVSRAEVLKVAKELRLEIISQQRVNSKTYLVPSQKLYQWLIAPLESELQAKEIKNITFIADTGLRFIPFAALHNGKQFLIEKYSLGLMPSLNLTDTKYTDLRKTQVLGMGASKFTDTSQSPLPAVPTELNTITQSIWKGSAFINQDFTLKNIQAQQQQRPYGILHLATHGEFNGGSLSNSYIQLWDQKLRLDQMRQMIRANPPVELLVLSACRTALGNDQAELGFAGFALEAGVKSAIASLWNVSDAGTLALMTEFYQQLKTAPIKAEALRNAQIAMITGKVRVESGNIRGTTGKLPLPIKVNRLSGNLSHPYYWAAFTIIGNPW